ncbi:MAG: GlsB/YeaQ/YmgE family stress response membrane protein [Planctomycetaceae bacterium]|nr:GlsB/YeaQ/YmgE family stress response membrane protein [Planctomycetaceae bacterium]
MGIIWAILLGMLAGWLAGQFWKGGGFGLLGNLIVGIVGSVLGSFAASLLSIHATGTLGNLIISVLGALLFLWLVNYFSGKK